MDILTVDLGSLSLVDLLKMVNSLRENETEVIELKENIIKPADISDYITQFANNRGGLLILGLTDEGKPSGKIRNYDKNIEINIRNADLTTIPSVGIDIKAYEHTGLSCWIIVIKIPKPNDGLQRISCSGALVKRVSSRRAIIQPTGYSYESQILNNSSLSDIDFTLINQFMSRLRTKVPNIPEDVNDLLSTFKLIQFDSNHIPHPTIAGMILFGKSPEVWIAGTRINVIRYTTVEKSNHIEESAVITGPILNTMEQANNVVWGLIRKSDFFISGKRNEISEYPRLALREAINNAFFHNDYSLPGSIFIEMFPDRLEIKNMGIPLGGTRLSDLVMKPKHRNPILLKVLSEMGFVEGWGIGLKTIIDNLRTNGLPEPKLIVSNEETCICFRTHSFMDKETLKWISSISSKTSVEMNMHQIIALAYTKHNKKMTNTIYQRINGVSTNVAGNELRELCSSGLFVLLGRGKSAYYSLTELFEANDIDLEEYFPKTIVLSLRPVQRKILSLVNMFGKINAKQIFYQSGYSDERNIKRILNGLVKLQLLKRVAKSASDPNAHYEVNKGYKKTVNEIKTPQTGIQLTYFDNNETSVGFKN